MRLRWQETRRAIAADRTRLREHYSLVQQNREPLWFQPAYIAPVLHRLAHHLHRAGRRLPARVLWRLNLLLTGADIDPAAEIGPGILIPVPGSVVCYAQLGARCVLHPQAAIGWGHSSGRSDRGRQPGRPVLADDVIVGPGAIVLGPVHVGHGARIGPRCLVMRDVAEGAIVEPRPWRVLPR